MASRNSMYAVRLTDCMQSAILYLAGSNNTRRVNRRPLAENGQSTRLHGTTRRPPAPQSCPAGRPRSRGSERTMSDDPKDPAPAPRSQPSPSSSRSTAAGWEVRDPDDELVCLTVYRKGAREVVRRLAA